MRAEVVAVGTELLLGQIVDTNSAWIGEQLALSGIDCNFQTSVGDNIARIASALRAALSRNEAVVICGGLGPTQDDLTREAIALVMNVPLRRDDAVLQAIKALFASRRPGWTMPANNERQADVPDGASVIPQTMGTAPGLICPVGNKVMYAVPGVPYELHDMMERAVLPDLRSRAGEASVIRSRTLRTWGHGRVRPGRASSQAASRRSRPAARACRRSPSWRAVSRGSRSGSRSRPPTRPAPAAPSTPKRPSSGRSSARRCSVSTRRRWRPQSAACS